MKRPAKKDAVTMARTFRIMFERELPRNPFERAAMTAYQFALLVQDQTKGSFEEAMDATAKIAPELFAEYWTDFQKETESSAAA
jgi:uncharacterized glyoxalase superfamily protein PhnB